ncbi:CPBP family intramembrane metalloprotease [Sphingomonas sp. JC676]|uniref:CPBP family intramembrane glutamic endopeptidase n=1 Tax=Sphingomonas sp. JC676 TaxID=2768065 RepID=UPI0016580FB4|nr:CPBP family intramembrane glutamic endopeptidase [Sphingomonas sp. JC676]MBC9033501.1 CPBP family intramembrane metalloprotease [Sphingomonas sp. JC676]
MGGIELGNAGVLRPGKLRWLRAIGWMLLLFVGLTAVFALFTNFGLKPAVEATGGTFTTPKAAPQDIKLAMILAGLAIVIALYVLAVRLGEKRRPVELAMRALPIELPAGLAVGGALMAATLGTLWATGWVTIHPQPVTRLMPAVREMFQSGVLEELLFRLVAFRLLWRAFGVWWALALSAALFGGLHLGNPNATIFAAICIAFEAGILLAAFYVLTGRAWAPIGVHAAWNFTQGWIFGAAVSGSPGGFSGGPLATQPVAGVPAIFSGGAFGPEGSLPALLICTGAGAGVLWLAWRRGKTVPAD